ncbi:MAG: hypothetical protein MZV49_23580 [Rhodopseudomonas palustris]|nr:hypothetical protein [Rhodopseudomonas palustris]
MFSGFRGHGPAFTKAAEVKIEVGCGHEDPLFHLGHDEAVPEGLRPWRRAGEARPARMA